MILLGVNFNFTNQLSCYRDNEVSLRELSLSLFFSCITRRKKPIAPESPSFIKMLYDQLKEKIAPDTGRQELVLEHPGRVINETNYHFDGDGSIYSNVVKPQVVLEEEFILTD